MQVGDLVERYRLTRRLGRGGFGEVWQAVADDGEVVAVKVLPLDEPTATTRAEQLEAYRRELEIARLIEDPGVVRVHRLVEGEDACFLIMDAVDGSDLYALMVGLFERGEPVPLPLAAYLVREVASILDMLHTRTVDTEAAGVLHRDLSPRNILVTRTGRVLLVDFGSSKRRGAHTTTLHPKGTPAYMAPEHHLNRKSDPAVDLYPLGVILHELLAGRRFRSDDPDKAFDAAMTQHDVPALDRPDVPAELDQLRRDLLSLRPDERPTAGEVVDAIDVCVPLAGAQKLLRAAVHAQLEQHGDRPAPASMPAGPTPADTADTAAPRSAAPPPERRRWLAPASALIVVGALAAGFALGRSDDDPAPAPPAPSPVRIKSEYNPDTGERDQTFWIKIDDAEPLWLDRYLDITLPPGSHLFRWRREGEGFGKGNRVTIEPDAQNRVHIDGVKAYRTAPKK